jgi:hypothetical protein
MKFLELIPVIKIRDVLAKVAPNGKPTSAAKLLATIADLEHQHREAMQLVAGADARANELLMADRDKEVDQLEADVREAQRTIDKIEVVLPGLRERLTVAQAHEKKATIARHQAKLKSLVEEQERAVKAALDLNAAIAQVRVEAFRELGTNVAHMTIPDCVYHGMLNPMGFDAWRAYVRSEVAGSPSDWPRAQTIPAATTPTRPDPIVSVAAPTPDVDGNIEILVGSNPISNGGGSFESWAPGTRVLMPKGFADLYVREGRAEYVAHVPASCLPASAPVHAGRKTPEKMRPPARPPLPVTPPEGFRRVLVLRAGYHDHDGRACERGIEIDLPAEIASLAEMNGAVEITRGDAAPN